VLERGNRLDDIGAACIFDTREDALRALHAELAKRSDLPTTGRQVG